MLLNLLTGFLAGFTGALGLGGGGVLVLFLTVFLGVSQLKAQGINLLFFIPIGIFALFFHARKKLVDWKAALPAVVCGLAGAALGCVLARYFGAVVVRKIFGALLLALGSWELFMPNKLKERLGGHCKNNPR